MVFTLVIQILFYQSFDLSDDVKEQMIEITRKIAIAIKTVGLINIQFAVKNDTAYVIEANPRALAQFHLLQKHIRTLRKLCHCYVRCKIERLYV